MKREKTEYSTYLIDEKSLRQGNIQSKHIISLITVRFSLVSVHRSGRKQLVTRIRYRF